MSRRWRSGTLWSAAASVTSRGGRWPRSFWPPPWRDRTLAEHPDCGCPGHLEPQIAGVMAGPAGRSFVRTYQRIIQAAEDPGVRLLTDSGLIDLHQKEPPRSRRPWLFRLLVETGQIRPLKMQGWIDSEAYDLVVTTSDLFSPGYVDLRIWTADGPGRTSQGPLRPRRFRVGPLSSTGDGGQGQRLRRESVAQPGAGFPSWWAAGPQRTCRMHPLDPLPSRRSVVEAVDIPAEILRQPGAEFEPRLPCGPVPPGGGDSVTRGGPRRTPWP